MNEQLDPRTPVVVGVGQASERLGDAGYQGLSAVGLAAEALRAALADAAGDGGDQAALAGAAGAAGAARAGGGVAGAARAGGGVAAIAAAVDTVAGVRQFETSAPGARARLGRSDNFPRSVAARAGLAPERAVLEVGGGQGPQHLVNEFAAAIAAGSAEVVALFGAEAISTVEHFAQAAAADRPDFTEHADGTLEDRGHGLAGMMPMRLVSHGLTDAPSHYALIDNARRARLGLSRAAYAAAMGELFEPFTKVAAANPHASAPVARTAADLVTPTAQNRPIADPYTRYIVAREKVNQGAAVLLMSVAAARRLGVPEERWVFLPGHADVRERDLMQRADLSSSPAAVLAARHALDVAGIAAGDLGCLDLYSCFPAPVFNVCDGLGLAADDKRGLTATGGLPFFGGAGNNYSMHAIAEIVTRVRANPGSFGYVGANGGMMSKYSAGVYSTTPANWQPDNSKELQEEIDAWPAPAEARDPDGWATVETYTVRHSRDGKRTGIVIGRLDADGRRFVACGDERDAGLVDLLTTGEPVGKRVYVRSFGFGNRVTVSKERMAELFPPPAGSEGGAGAAISAAERTALRAAVRDLLRDACTEQDVRKVMNSGAGFDRGLWRQLAELGVTGMLIDPGYGGSGLGALELEAVTEETGAALLPSPFISSGVLAASLIQAAGTPQDRQRLLPGLARGQSIATVALTGRKGTWTADGVDVTAGADGALTGAARYVTFGQAADVIVVAARTADGIGVFEVAPDAAGFARTAENVFDPTVRLSAFAFDATPARRLGTAGWGAVQDALDLAVIALAGEQAGGARRIFDITVGYLKTRVQFGRFIGSFQAMKHFAADLLLEVESATSAARHAAAQYDAAAGQPGAAAGAVALAGFACAEAFEATALHAIQMHGGIGFTWEHPAHLFLRRARSGAQLFGGSRAHRERYLVSKGA